MKSLFPLVAVVALSLHSATAQDSPALAPLPPDGFVTLTQIVNDFSSNPDAANAKYNGMRILVYGRVGVVAQSGDADGDPLAVYMQLPNQTTPDVKAVFPADDVPDGNLAVSEDQTRAAVYQRNWDGEIVKQRTYIVVGENVGIRGTFDSFVAGDVVLKNSMKLTDRALEKKLAEHGLSTE